MLRGAESLTVDNANWIGDAVSTSDPR
jgi:hypothetical protein